MAYLLKNDGTFSDFRTALAGTSFLEKLDRFLDEYGHRGRYESDWALPRMHENPAAGAVRDSRAAARADSGPESHFGSADRGRECGMARLRGAPHAGGSGGRSCRKRVR